MTFYGVSKQTYSVNHIVQSVLDDLHYAIKKPFRPEERVRI